MLVCSSYLFKRNSFLGHVKIKPSSLVIVKLLLIAKFHVLRLAAAKGAAVTHLLLSLPLISLIQFNISDHIFYSC